MAGRQRQEEAKRKKREKPLPSPSTSTANGPKDREMGVKKPRKGGKHSRPTPSPLTSTTANARPNRNKKGGKKTEAATESLSSEDLKPESIEMMDADDDDEELIWDPETSYVGIDLELDEEAQTLGSLEPERSLWKKEGSPIHLRSEIPPEWKWHDREPDLSRDDIDGQIKRAKERIDAGIMPNQFKIRLTDYEAQKAARDQVQARFPGKPFEVAKRLSDLHFIRGRIWERGSDKEKHLPNIEAIIRAYESGELEWNEGLVTYWSHGKQLCKPRLLDMEEFMKVNKKYGGHESFWAEGAFPLQAHKSAVMVDNSYKIGRARADCYYWVNLGLKIRGAPDTAALDLEFMEDSGAGIMSISGADVLGLHAQRVLFGPRAAPRLPPLVGRTVIELANGAKEDVNVIILEVNYPTPPGGVGYVVPTWSLVQAAVWDERNIGGHFIRLAGPWLRSQLFTATVPDGKYDIWVTDAAAGLAGVGPRPQPPLAVGVLKPLGRRPLPHRYPIIPIPPAEARDY